MSTETRLRPSEHGDLPWRINEVTHDFDLIDAWVLPATGTLDEFGDLCRIFGNLDPADDRGSSVSRTLFAARAWLGGRMGWDDPEVVNKLAIPGCEEFSVRDRLPVELTATVHRTSGDSNFRGVFEVDDEAAFELSNSLVHAILHLGWARQPDGHYRGQMGVYVKYRGKIGAPYMAVIAPFRHHIVYPALLRRIGAAWESRSGE
ncbi:MAG: hypothetical protein ACI8TP_005388 [Acidimicrobiales bacterium]|jgi:hypothetical protein